MRKEVTDGNSCLTVVLKFPGTGQGLASVIELGGLHFQAKGFTVLLCQSGFGIKGIHAGGASVHVEKNYVFGLWCKVGRFRRQGIKRLGLCFFGQH